MIPFQSARHTTTREFFGFLLTSFAAIEYKDLATDTSVSLSRPR